jgi:hypothetical protein
MAVDMMLNNAALKEKIAKAVETSMRIEGYPPAESARLKESAKALMVKRNVQVSIPRK